jgi:protein-tyrosine phosphatase
MALSARELQGAWNFRDVADSTGVLRPGRLFRSGELSDLGDDGRDELHRLGITDVADLRSRREVERHGPGRVPDGVTIHLLPIPDLGPEDLDADGDRRTSTRFGGCWKTRPTTNRSARRPVAT